MRHAVLRPGKPIETCVFEGDDLSTTFHLGIYFNDTLVGVCSFFKNNHPEKSDAKQYQLRGMAVLSDYQGKQLGKQLLNYGEAILKSKKTTMVWCNAREVALTFYKKSGYHIFGEPFDIPTIGKHYSMSKQLQ
ncbi:GNAT family N-acetyltransferase [Tamlana sp. I1]|uniref:GNAT family N-acetyltransferase n=1 Tax=Tamlana sp. I1 TaxID=2762061 RepID=UPI00293BB352|nr:GNAT family N-acetyltransferase [Tamlana sp. I1]